VRSDGFGGFLKDDRPELDLDATQPCYAGVGHADAEGEVLVRGDLVEEAAQLLPGLSTVLVDR
jgi:hypothetical protein